MRIRVSLLMAVLGLSMACGCRGDRSRMVSNTAAPASAANVASPTSDVQLVSATSVEGAAPDAVAEPKREGPPPIDPAKAWYESEVHGFTD